MLIEILVVVTIIGLVASIIGIGLFQALTGAQIDTTTVQMKSLEDSLELYRIANHTYPSTAEGLDVLVRAPPGRRSVMNDVPKDAWGNDFIYLSPGQRSARFDLSSKGPDGVGDTADDINNWGLTARASN